MQESLLDSQQKAQNAAFLMRAATWASVSAALLMVGIKLYAYLVTDSVSLLSTLFDSLLDVGASLVNFIAIHHALTPADAEHRFGHGKAEPLAGIAQVAFIMGSSVLLLLEVGEHFLHPKNLNNPGLGIVVMLASIAITGLLLLFQRHVVRKTRSTAIHADSVHYGSDFLVNLGVIAALILGGRFGWLWADPVFGLAIAVFIAYSAVEIGRNALDMLMDREMDGAERDRIKAIVRANPEVLNLHELRTRVAGLNRFIQFHLELPPEISLKDAHRISDAVEERILQVFPGAQVIIHQDPYGVPERRIKFD